MPGHGRLMPGHGRHAGPREADAGPRETDAGPRETGSGLSLAGRSFRGRPFLLYRAPRVSAVIGSFRALSVCFVLCWRRDQEGASRSSLCSPPSTVLASGLDGQYTQQPTGEAQSSSVDRTETKKQTEAESSARGSESRETGDGGLLRRGAQGDISGGPDLGIQPRWQEPRRATRSVAARKSRRRGSEARQGGPCRAFETSIYTDLKARFVCGSSGKPPQSLSLPSIHLLLRGDFMSASPLP